MIIQQVYEKIVLSRAPDLNSAPADDKQTVEKEEEGHL